MTQTSRAARSAARALAGATLAALATATLTACVGGDDDSVSEGKSPEEVMKGAKTKLDETSGVDLSLASSGEPPGDNYISAADGTITADPEAFEGTADGKLQGLAGSDVGIISVGGKTWVDVPFVGWTTYDPAEFCAPDPATLLRPDSGVSNLLVTSEDLEAGEAERGGSDNETVLTPYSGTAPSSAVTAILPCAPGDEFDVTYRIDADGYLVSAELTGEFYEGGGEMTYTIDVHEYDVEKEIVAPE